MIATLHSKCSRRASEKGSDVIAADERCERLLRCLGGQIFGLRRLVAALFSSRLVGSGSPGGNCPGASFQGAFEPERLRCNSRG